MKTADRTPYFSSLTSASFVVIQLPYGTMSDEEMRKLDVPSLQEEGYIFLWVTGR